MLVIATATRTTGAVTHHLVRAENGPAAYRRIKPLLSPGSLVDTMSLEHWAAKIGPLPQDLRALDHPDKAELAAIAAAGGRLIPASTPAPNPAV